MSYNVLLVDDSVTSRGMCKKALGMSGLEVGTVEEAADGKEALKILAEHWIDIVFTDLHMPLMNGVELIERMAADKLMATIPVVVVSADRSPATQGRLEELGVRAHIKKPWRPEELHQIVKRILGPTVGKAP